jgi:acetolactate synthase I/II/III large subunit
VANAFRFQDTFDNHHPQYAGDVGLGINPALARRVRESDLLLAIGPRLGEATTGGYTLIEAPVPAQKLVHIHASAEELNRVYQADAGDPASMNAAARSLEGADRAARHCLGRLDGRPATPTTWPTSMCQRRVVLPGSIDMPAIIHSLQSTCRPTRC